MKFDRDKVPFQQISEKRYAHIACHTRAEASRAKEEKDKEALENYIINLFKIDYINPRIRKQIKEYVEDYHFTYSGILNTLKYWYEIKKNDIAKSNGALGIVPYVYQQAYDYFYSLWLAHEKNKNKEFTTYIPTVREVHIPVPERKILKKNKFSFLDEEVNQ